MTHSLLLDCVILASSMLFVVTVVELITDLFKHNNNTGINGI